ncbi:alpha/beta fold hydrolase [Mycoplasma sp. NEAQ87857]|uniref:alpha/beta fold hydrolase n=1 Tax=Mycoplasma sp. NEAQ87857 TaxID=2683967 RepID=UPI001315B609|nr:alpha/beta hydrolase [Mycoplasma sp. NEAQ87857]QGZ97908.1 alpha/beta fold hydrolase [Mycoplasma sp. NEAQ87857]
MFIYKNLELQTLEIDNKKDKNVFFVHGVTADYSNFNDFYPELSKEYNIYSINLPCHGDSQCNPELMNINSYIDILYQYILSLKLNNIYLIGHSMGGAIAMVLSAKIEPLIKKMILIAPLNETSMEIQKQLKYAFEAKTLLAKLAFVKRSYYHPLKMLFNKQINQNTKEWFIKHKDDLPYYRNLGNSMLDYDFLAQTRVAIEEFNKPLALIYGVGDDIINRLKIKAYFQSVQPNIQVFEVPKCGHNLWYENKAEAVKVVLDFLEK